MEGGTGGNYSGGTVFHVLNHPYDPERQSTPEGLPLPPTFVVVPNSVKLEILTDDSPPVVEVRVVVGRVSQELVEKLVRDFFRGVVF